jgi:hypothetical protein
MTEPKIIRSPLSRKYTEGETTVDVDIYRLETSNEWTLELVDKDWTSTVWEEPFPTDQAAWDEFVSEVKEYGLLKLLEVDGEEPSTVH